jgi:hypothetical protein
MSATSRNPHPPPKNLCPETNEIIQIEQAPRELDILIQATIGPHQMSQKSPNRSLPPKEFPQILKHNSIPHNRQQIINSTKHPIDIDPPVIQVMKKNG